MIKFSVQGRECILVRPVFQNDGPTMNPEIYSVSSLFYLFIYKLLPISREDFMNIDYIGTFSKACDHM